MTKNEKVLIYTMASAQFANIMDFMIMMPLGPQLMRMFEISAQQFSWLVASYSISAGVSGFLVAFLADRKDRKKLLIWMYSGFTVGTFACGLAPTYWFLLIARFITGLFGGIISSVVMAIVSDVVPMQRRGQAMGMVTTAFSAASVFGVPFGLFLANLISWHAPFIFLAVFSIPVLFLMQTKLPKVDSHLKNQTVKPYLVMKNIWTNKNQVRALGFICVLMFAHFSIIPFISPSMVANVGFTEHELTWIYFLGGAFSIVSGPFIGKLADRLGKQRVYVYGVFFSFIPILWITHMGPTALPLALIATTMFFVSAGWRMIPAMAIVSGTVKPENRGSFMSFQSCLQSIAMGMASFMAGLIVTRSPDGHLQHYPIVGYVSVLAALICLFLVRKIKVIEKESSEGFYEA